MRILLQRVKHAEVRVDGKITGKIDKGLLLFIGITHTDTEKEADYLAEKCVNLRIFEDENGKMNLSVQDVNGELLAVSQFTLYGNARKGRRPAFVDAARPEEANKLYEYFVKKLRSLNFDVQTGVFQEHMDVELVNDGPVTLMLER